MKYESTREPLRDGKEKYQKINVIGNSPQATAQRGRIATNRIIKCMAEGYTYREIEDMLQHDEMGLNFNYTPAMSRKMVHKAVDIIKKNCEEELPHLREKIINCYWDTYRNARESGDRGAAVKALNEVSKITGVYKESMDLNHQGYVTIDFGTKTDVEENEE